MTRVAHIAPELCVSAMHSPEHRTFRSIGTHAQQREWRR